MDEFESPELEALPFEEISDDCPPTPESSDTSDVVSTQNQFDRVGHRSAHTHTHARTDTHARMHTREHTRAQRRIKIKTEL